MFDDSSYTVLMEGMIVYLWFSIFPWGGTSDQVKGVDTQWSGSIQIEDRGNGVHTSAVSCCTEKF
jgi:hypothetical protein